jgi:hypothetical protein
LLDVDERPYFIALGTAYAEIPHIGFMECSAGASRIFQETKDGVFSYSEHSARRVNGIALNESRYDLGPFGCV